MINPERVDGKTPNGGAYSEFWYLKDDGTPAKNMKEAKRFKVLELSKSGQLIQTTYGILEKQ